MEGGWSQTTSRYDRVFSIVRHPVDRWWSGIHQYHLNNQIPHEELFDQARSGKFHFDQHTQPQVKQVPAHAHLVPFERMGEFAELLGLNLREIRVRGQSIEASDLVPTVLGFYAEDLVLYERALQEFGETVAVFSNLV